MSCPHGRPKVKSCATCIRIYNRDYKRRRVANGGQRLGYPSRPKVKPWPQPQTELDRTFIAWASAARWPVGWTIGRAA